MADVTSLVSEVIAARMRSVDRSVRLSDTLDSLGLESLDVLEIAFDLEQRFGVEIPFNANTKLEFDTVGDLVQAIERLIAEKAEKAGAR
ncbi:MAG TPA: phosphopantetheine-binding protein [Xanthobacteraceae bacterium]